MEAEKRPVTRDTCRTREMWEEMSSSLQIPCALSSLNPLLGNGGPAQTPAQTPAGPAPTRTCPEFGPERSPSATWLPPEPAFQRLGKDLQPWKGFRNTLAEGGNSPQASPCCALHTLALPPSQRASRDQGWGPADPLGS